MVATRQTAEPTPFVHLMNNVLTSAAYAAAFDAWGVATVTDFLSLTKEDIESDFPGADGAIAQLRLMDRKKLLDVQAWFHDSAEDLSPNVWFALTADVLESFRSTRTVSRTLEVPPSPTMPAAGSIQVQSAATTERLPPDLAYEFAKATKRSFSDLKQFKDAHQWTWWHRHLISTSRAQGIGNVYDLHYEPSTDPEHNLFRLQNEFAFSCLEQALHTADGKLFIREFQETGNARGVYQRLVATYNTGEAGRLKAEKIETELQDMRLDVRQWKKGCQAFLTAWEHKIRDLAELDPDAVTDSKKWRWLRTAVLPHKTMEAAITNFDSLDKFARKMTPDGNGLGFQEMFNQLVDAATRHDKITKDNVANQQRRIQEGKFQTVTNKKGTKGPGDGKNAAAAAVWKYYSPQEWEKLPLEKRKQILEQRKVTPRPPRPQRSTSASTTTTQSSSTEASASVAQIPTTVIANQAQVDAQSVVSTGSTPTASGSASGATIRSMLSNAAHSRRVGDDDSVMVQEGRVYLRVKMANVHYRLRAHSAARTICSGSLIDGGANGGLCGSDVLILSETGQHCDVTGITNNAVTDLPIVQAAALIHSSIGPIIGIFHQYASIGEGKTVHSCAQLRSFGTVIDDVPISCGGTQRLVTPEGYIVPLSVRDGLVYMDMNCPTHEDLARYPHVMFTSDDVWNPSLLDHEHSLNGEHHVDDVHGFRDHRVNDFGEIIFDHQARVDYCSLHAHEASVHRHDLHYDAMRPYLGWVNLERVKKTFENTTQWFRASVRLPFRHHFKSRFPAANVPRLHETVATDTFFSDVPAHDDGILGHGGATMVQVYCGKDSQLTRGYPMTSEHDMFHTLEDFIRQEGAPDALLSDNAKAQIGKNVQQILRMYRIADFQCEPHYQHQNYAERRIQEVKKAVNALLDRTGTPSAYWLLAMLYVIHLLNHLAVASLNWKTPLEVAHGEQPDISPFLQFRWWEPVYFEAPSTSGFPSSSVEKTGRWVGIAEHQGDVLTYLVLTDDTLQVLARSNVRSALSPTHPNYRAYAPLPSDGGEDLIPMNVDPGDSPRQVKDIIYNSSDIAGFQHVDPSELKLPFFTPDELLNRTFIHDVDGQRMRAKVVRKILDNDAFNHQNIKFLLEIGAGEFDEIIAYNELSDLVERQVNAELNHDDLFQPWSYDDIIAHQGPLKPTDPFYKGSLYNVLVRWTNGEESYEPLLEMIKDDPISTAKYAKEQGLLDTPGWKKLQKFARRIKKFERMVKQAKLQRERRGIRFKFGVQVPRNWNEAVELDAKSNTTLWQDAVKKEMDQIAEYGTFRDLGRGATAPSDYKKITARLVFDVKHDLRRKARLVAGGHLTDPPKDSVYSGVVSLRSLRLVALIAELNGLHLWAADVGNAYLEASTKEKVYVIAGPEFGAQEGHVLLIHKALYGLRTSGARWHEHFADTLRNLGFTPCKADPDVWMRNCSTHYEYICVYVDDLAIAMKNPQEFVDVLMKDCGYKLKGVGPMEYHLGADIYRDSDGTLCFGAKSYIARLLRNYETLFGEQPKEYTSPLDRNDHPELDTSNELPELGIKRFQSLIGALQWAISLCRFDIQCAVMTLGRFRAAPRLGHMMRVQRICGYLRKKPDAAIRFRVGIPDTTIHVEPTRQNWEYVYGNLSEEMPFDMPLPLGKSVRITTFEDANLLHDHVTGRSAMGVLHFVNQTPVEWFSKRQNTVETATYGSEFVVARTATEQIIDLRYTLRMLGVPLDGPAWMFGDNESVVKSATIPHSSLMKRHNALAYHRVREAIAAKVLHFCHIPGSQNPADVLTKFLPWATSWPLIEPILFWKGETDKSASTDDPQKFSLSIASITEGSDKTLLYYGYG